MMNNNLIQDFVKKNFKGSSYEKIEQDASNRIYYRIYIKKKSYILLDSKKELNQFRSLLNIYEILNNLDISIPKIYDLDKNLGIAVLEDFGEYRFDKLIFKKDYCKILMKLAVDNLVEFKNSIKLNNKSNIAVYNFEDFIQEISEFVDWYLPFILKRKLKKSFIDNFYEIWTQKYNEIKLEFDTFSHKDFFCNNLFFLPNRKNHLKCGIIDYQDAIFSDNALDIVSLFEDSRRLIKNFNKNELIEFYLQKTNKFNQIENFHKKIDFIGAARQTRILGRWVKLYKLNKKKHYIQYIPSTWFWLEKNLENDFLFEIKKYYNELVPLEKRRYEY